MFTLTRFAAAIVIAAVLIPAPTSAAPTAHARDAGQSIANSPTGVVPAITAGFSHTCALDSTGQISCWGFNESGQLGNGTTDNQTTPPAPITLPAGTTATAITAGFDHTCALLNTGEVTCWGDDALGQLGNGPAGDQTTPPAPITLPAGTTATAITAGRNHTCALLNTAQITCWGNDADGRLGNGTGNGNGNQQSPPTPITLPAGTTATAIDAGDSHTCALLNTAQITCWGSDDSGRLGNGTGAGNGSQQSPPTPITLPAGTTATAITAGDNHTCALLNTAQITCWGRDSNGQLGNGTGNANQQSPPTPITLPAGTTATAITASSSYTCALLNTAQVTCWGFNGSGRLGTGNTNELNTPSAPITLPTGTTATAITAGFTHTCALLNTGQAACWGSGGSGRLGNGTTTNQLTPMLTSPLPAVDPTRRATAIATGSFHTCAVLATGEVTCWGEDNDGQLGNGTAGNQTTPPAPITLPANTTATAITAEEGHTCALLNTGQVTCWGNDQDGQLGNDTNGDQQTPPTPITLPAGTTATAITAGFGHTCALLNTGQISCWGNDSFGQLGNGTAGAQQSPPTPITLPANTTATAITTGDTHNCALLNTGQITCWGHDQDGQLGNGADGRQQTPPAPITLPANTTATAVSGGFSHTCALLNTGHVTCWGNDQQGQLGNGTDGGQQSPPAPITLPANATATAIAAGLQHTCALLNTGHVTCWGNDSFGQLGNGTDGNQQSPPTPITLPGGATATAISTNTYHTCALLNTGDIACWGIGTGGRLGNGTTPIAQQTPTLVTFPTATPTLALATGQADPTNDTTVNVAATFDEPVTLTATDVTLTGTAGATAATPTGSGTTWNIAITGMTTDGTIVVSIPAGTLSVYGNTTSNTLSIDYDTTGPTASITEAGGQADPATATPVSFTVTFDEPVTGFDTNDITIGGTAGATLANTTITGSGTTYTVTINQVPNPGTITLDINPAAVTDNLTNPSTTTIIDNTITINDTTGPIIVVPTDIVVDTEPDAPTATVTYTVTATDPNSTGTTPNNNPANFAGTVTVDCTPPSGSQFPIGTTTVTCTATDTTGNTSTATFTITVNAQTTPATTTTTTTTTTPAATTTTPTTPTTTTTPATTTTIAPTTTTPAATTPATTVPATSPATVAPPMTIDPNITLPATGNSNRQLNTTLIIGLLLTLGGTATIRTTRRR